MTKMDSKSKGFYLITVVAIVMLQVIYILYKERKPELIHYEIIEDAAHSTDIFTQGFEIVDDKLCESSGRANSKSFLQCADLITNEVIVKNDTPKLFSFAEGLTVLDDKIFWLTWKAEKAFVMSASNLEHINTFKYQGEGWGLTNDSQNLIMSNGTNELSIYNPKTFELTKTLRVENLSSSWKLNELDFNDGILLANAWKKPYIAIIKMSSDHAKLIGYLDLSDIVDENKNGKNNDLNGIAYDKTRNGYWITGKRWSKRFLIQINPVI